MTATSCEDRILGCLLGGALGDALGAWFEGKPVSEDFDLPSQFLVTDDTQLTMATCESLIAAKAVHPAAVAGRLIAWFRDSRITGMGASTFKALTELNVGARWASAGATGEHAAGNGAAIRVALLAFFLNPDVATDRQTLRDVCRITHRHDEAYVGALAIVRVVRHVMRDETGEVDILRQLVSELPDSRVRDRLAGIATGCLDLAQYAARFGTSGYVVDSVPAAILAALQYADPLAMVRAIIRCGGDTDSIASMAGQILGAEQGIGRLPLDLIRQIDVYQDLIQLASSLARLKGA